MITRIELIQIYHLWLSNIKIRYRKTWAGFLWVILNPLILLVIQTFIFSHVLKLPTHHYFLYLVCGYLPWVFISQSLEMGTSLLKTSSPTIKAFSIKPFQIIAALILENLMNFFSVFIIALLPFAFASDRTLWFLPLWILSTLPLSICIFAITFLSSTTNVLLRDLRFIVSFALSVFYFATPIFYSPDMIPERWSLLIQLNPFYILIQPFQYLSLSFDGKLWVLSFLKSLSFSCFSLMVAFFVWKKVKNSFYLKL